MFLASIYYKLLNLHLVQYACGSVTSTSVFQSSSHVSSVAEAIQNNLPAKRIEFQVLNIQKLSYWRLKLNWNSSFHTFSQFGHYIGPNWEKVFLKGMVLYFTGYCRKKSGTLKAEGNKIHIWFIAFSLRILYSSLCLSVSYSLNFLSSHLTLCRASSDIDFIVNGMSIISKCFWCYMIFTSSTFFIIIAIFFFFTLTKFLGRL